MADEDKEKAEKIAAAKKRFEELKKQKAKEAEKSGSDAKPKKKSTKKKTANKDAKDKDKDKDDKKDEDDADDNDDDGNATADETAATNENDDPAARIESLESELSELRQKHSDAEARIVELQAKLRASEDKEKATLQKPSATIRPGARKSVDGDSGGLEELEDEERRQLQSRVRELEAEVYELRQKAWTGQQTNAQGQRDDSSTAARSPGAFSDVDLSQGPYSNRSRRQSSGVGQAFGLQNVINAFTGPAGVTPQSQHRRGPSKGDGLLDDDDMDFDEDAFRKAQEEEANARLERVREVKRGLSGWKGWKVDLVELRGGADAGVFDV